MPVSNMISGTDDLYIDSISYQTTCKLHQYHLVFKLLPDHVPCKAYPGERTVSAAPAAGPPPVKAKNQPSTAPGRDAAGKAGYAAKAAEWNFVKDLPENFRTAQHFPQAVHFQHELGKDTS